MLLYKYTIFSFLVQVAFFDLFAFFAFFALGGQKHCSHKTMGCVFIYTNLEGGFPLLASLLTGLFLCHDEGG